MKKLLSLIFALVASVAIVYADSFTAGGETYNYTITKSSTPSAGVTYKRMRFTAPSACNVSLVEVDLTNSDVRVEAFIGMDKIMTLEAPTAFSARKKTEGRNPIVVQNGHFWSMSSQTTTSAGVHATQTCLGGCMVNGNIITETNWAHDQWNGGPTRTGVLGITADKKAVIGNYQTAVKAMCPAKWGTDESSNSLLITDVNKYCIASDYMALFTPEFPNTKAFKVLNTSAGQPGTVVTGTSTEVYLKMDAGQTMKHNTWVTATVGKIVKNTSGGTRGDYDFVLVAAPGVSQNVLASVAVGDKMKFKYYWHLKDNETNIPAFENVIAGNAIVMKNGALTTRATDESYNTTSYARSLYGINADGTKLYMCVVDKGQNETEGVSYGATCTRISYIMNNFGAKTVLQVDGGGSAQMAINGELAGKPADGSERKVASGMVVYSLSASGSGDNNEDDDNIYESAESGYSLMSVWKQKTGHLGVDDARWATAFDGKIYVNDKANSILYYWSENGLKNTGLTSSTGSAIACDEAGNIILSSTFAKATDATSFKILPAGGTTFRDLSVTLPTGVSGNTMQYMGHAIGNVMNSAGGAIYLFPKDATSVAKIVIKNGVQVSSTAIPVDVITSDGQAVAFPLTDDVNSNDIAARLRTGKSFYHSNGTSFVAFPNNGISSTAGGTIFTMGGVQYAVEPVGTNYRDGFQIVDLDKNKVVAKHTEELTITAKSPNPNCIVAEVKGATTTNIYQYVPGQLAAQYTFSVESTTAIKDVQIIEECLNKPIEYYNMQGVKVINPSNGIFIKKQGRRITKIVL